MLSGIFFIVFPLFSFVFAGWRAAKEWHMGAGSLYLHMEIYAPTCVWLSWGEPTKYFTKFNWNIWIINNICVCRFLPPFVFGSCLGSFEMIKFVWKYKLLPLVVTNLSLEPRLYFRSFFLQFHMLLFGMFCWGSCTCDLGEGGGCFWVGLEWWPPKQASQLCESSPSS